MIALDLMNASFGYLRRNPRELLKTARELVGLRLGIPIDGLRWLAEHALPQNLFPIGLSVEAAPPLIRLGAQVNAMGTPLRASLCLGVDEVVVNADALRLSLRIADVDLKMAGESVSPLAVLIKSGVLDLSRPGDLVHHLPMRPPVIAEAEGDRIVFDLFKIPLVAVNPAVRVAAALLSAVLSVEAIEADEERLYVVLRRS